VILGGYDLTIKEYVASAFLDFIRNRSSNLKPFFGVCQQYLRVVLTRLINVGLGSGCRFLCNPLECRSNANTLRIQETAVTLEARPKPTLAIGRKD